ncbi:helix-turn-helix transcriptional regulator [Pacificimonas sp. WHA3]|uniref:Helix-turn-helix transcriptional regulator n=1 Tax=Pacificimonas pallii TaxID=2827236 RepID=A0ABS6SD82_9SPHN|nr:helix-turn-helix transcriptional regulator [Pacificimonas pallii]MBV7256377.1 helix-turn-helix transcriptional regulator [Pacificimonas pallii]
MGRQIKPEKMPVERLSDGQRDVLRLVFLHMSSKDIAREIGISPHTVDQRVKRAMGILKVTNRWEAARILAESEGAVGYDGDLKRYQSLVYQSPDIDDAAVAASPSSHTGHGGRYEEQELPAPQFHDSAAAAIPSDVYAETGGWASGQVLPLPQGRGAQNTLSIPVRLAWMIAIIIGVMIGFGALMAGVEALGQML